MVRQFCHDWKLHYPADATCIVFAEWRNMRWRNISSVIFSPKTWSMQRILPGRNLQLRRQVWCSYSAALVLFRQRLATGQPFRWGQPCLGNCSFSPSSSDFQSRAIQSWSLSTNTSNIPQTLYAGSWSWLLPKRRVQSGTLSVGGCQIIVAWPTPSNWNTANKRPQKHHPMVMHNERGSDVANHERKFQIYCSPWETTLPQPSLQRRFAADWLAKES